MPNPEYLDLSPDLLRRNPWNTNRVSAEHEDRIRQSIERNGIFKPILVREVEGQGGYEIIGGEHRWEQAVALDFKTIPVVNLGPIDDRRAKEIGVIDNTRYGVDDAIPFAELLREIGDPDELQDFLPLGTADLEAIFSATEINLDELELDDNFEAPETEDASQPIEKPAKTHTTMRFKLELADAERVTALIASTRRDQGLSGADELTLAGDALVILLKPYLSNSAKATQSDA